MRSLVVGLGIGKLYVDVLTKLGADVVTVDMDASKNPTFTDFKTACASSRFDTVHICTPNFTHEELFYAYVNSNPTPNSIVFVEKPGFETARRWKKACSTNVRLMMVKNNQYRSNIEQMRNDAQNSKYVNLDWINYNRVPNPGSWFTTKELAWGGVSRDLIPHLLSYLPIFYPRYYRNLRITKKLVNQRSQLHDLTSSEYGTVKADGIYDVDDYCSLEMTYDNLKILLSADWRSMREDNVSIEMTTGTKYPLGLCPEDAYSKMIQTAIEYQNDDTFWQNQMLEDIWIHTVLEELNGA